MILERLKSLRAKMTECGMDYYMIPTADFHQSEYVSDYFKVREYFCAFTGSNGTLLVWQEGAGLWTDGRYFIQAERELAGTGVTLFRMQEEGVPTLEEFLKQHMCKGQVLGFDGRVISMSLGMKLEKLLGTKGITLAGEQDLAEGIWKNRPEFPAGIVTLVSEELSGKDTLKKRTEVIAQMKRAGAEAMFLSKLDDIMWLLNIRGCDVECNPVAMSYVYLTETECVLFIQKDTLTAGVRAYLAEKQVTLVDYEEVLPYLCEHIKDKKVLLDKRYVSYLHYRRLCEITAIVEDTNPTELLKAIKNDTELANMKHIFLQDSVAVTKFIYWLKTHIGKERITECSAAAYLDQLRRQIPECFGLSFPTISAYNVNAAMMHYEATEENQAILEKQGMLLVDSGGQYYGGTTDVTRTIVLGPITEEMRKHYTLVAAGMLNMTNARFLYGCTGRNLDILAREPLWQNGLDYKCGTGHGVGYMLNVHEGPHSLRWRYVQDAREAVLEEGMDVTNEPGIYIEGSHGIRIENVLVVRKDLHNEYGQFMHFDTLTWVPLEKDAIDTSLLSSRELQYLQNYQQAVYEKIAPFMTEEEREWLREITLC